MTVEPIPEGYDTVTPYLVVRGAEALLDFTKKVFGAEETVRMPGPDGSIGHAEIRIGKSIVMLADPSEQSPEMPATVMVYVEDCDGVYARALEAGGTSLREPTNEFYGDRMAGVRDPLGDRWWIATHVEDVPEDEMRRRAEEVAGGGSPDATDPR